MQPDPILCFGTFSHVVTYIMLSRFHELIGSFQELSLTFYI